MAVNEPVGIGSTDFSEALNPETTASPRASTSKDKFQVVIAGIGPAGLLVAHYLLERGEGRFNIRMCDRGPDPREAAKGAFTRDRYSLVLYVRGLLALKGVEGLLPRVMAAGSLSDSTTIYKANGQVLIKLEYGSNIPDFIKERGLEHTQQLVVDRMELSAVMLTALVERYGSSGLLEFAFGRECTDVDARTRNVTVVNDVSAAREKWSYDLLVGADGVGSVVRQALVQTSRGFDFEQVNFFGNRRRMKFTRPDWVEPMSSHIFPSLQGTDELGAFILPDRASLGTMSLALVWHHNKPPLNLLAIRDVVEMRQWLREHLPLLGDVPDESLADLLQPTTARPRAIKCNRYHDSDARVALIGDAAHSTIPILGQGCNAALAGSAVLARLLLGENLNANSKRPEFGISRTGGAFSLSVNDLRAQLPSMLARYSALQVKDGHALVDICSAYDCLDEKERKRMNITNYLRDTVATVLQPWVPLSFVALTTTTTEPYGNIYNYHKRKIQSLNTASQKVIEAWHEEEVKKMLPIKDEDQW